LIKVRTAPGPEKIRVGRFDSKERQMSVEGSEFGGAGISVRQGREDYGSIFLTDTKDGNMRIAVRQPGHLAESVVTLPREKWREMIAGDDGTGI
jgi:hypothetical protein